MVLVYHVFTHVMLCRYANRHWFMMRRTPSECKSNSDELHGPCERSRRCRHSAKLQLIPLGLALFRIRRFKKATERPKCSTVNPESKNQELRRLKGGASLTELRLFVASAAELQELSPVFEGSVSPCEAEVMTQETRVQQIAVLPSRPKLASRSTS